MSIIQKVLIDTIRWMNKMFRFIAEINADAKITEEDILNIEASFGIRFPNILRDFYKEYNGAKIKLCVVTQTIL